MENISEEVVEYSVQNKTCRIVRKNVQSNHLKALKVNQRHTTS